MKTPLANQRTSAAALRRFSWHIKPRPDAGVANESKPGRNFPKDQHDSIFHFCSAIANLRRPF
jgi:hypothetical protein